MRSAEALWRALERSALTGSRREWQEVLGADFDAASPFLRLLPEPLRVLPCPRGGDEHLVIDHGDGDIEVVCQSDQCEVESVSKADLAAYRLCIFTLGTHVAAALGIPAAPSEIEGLPRTLHLGDLIPRAGERFPVFMSCPQTPRAFTAVVERLVARWKVPFVLVTPAIFVCPPAATEALRTRDAELIVLEEVLGVDESGALVRRETDSDLLAAFRARVVPKRESLFVPFDTPAEAKWEDVEMRFVNRDEVAIDVLGVGAGRTWKAWECGMASVRAGRKPRLQWTLLRKFADNGGVISWTTPKPKQSLQKQRENLSRDLKNFFRIDGDPIVNEGRSWRIRLKLHPET